MLAAPGCDQQNGASANNADPTVQAGENPIDALTPEDRQAFMGNGSIGGQLASISLPSTSQESAFLSDPSSGPAFLRYVFATYPDLHHIAFKPAAEIRADPETFEMYRQSFYAGLYFAKRIHLANGETLFDLLTKCSPSVDPLTSAEVDPMAKPRPGFSMQFFPVLRVADGGTTDLQILLDRQGDRVTARSPLFSSSVLASPTFMADHNVSCPRG